MKKRSVALVMSVFLCAFALASCSTIESYHGAGIGGAIGAIAGALIDRGNMWRGAAIGAALGAALGGTVTEISRKAATEAAERGEPVTYRSEDGKDYIEARPLGYNARTDCSKVQERVWQDDRLVKNQITEVCRGQKREPRY